MALRKEPLKPRREVKRSDFYRFKVGDKGYWKFDPYPFEVFEIYETGTQERRYWIKRGGECVSVNERNLRTKKQFIKYCEWKRDTLKKKYENAMFIFDQKIKIAESGAEASQYMKVYNKYNNYNRNKNNETENE